jgi:hypothetical protein
VVSATMSKAAVVLKRPAGSNGRFAEHSDLASDLGSGEKGVGRQTRRAQPAKRAKLSEREVEKAAADFEKEDKRREAERRGAAHRLLKPSMLARRRIDLT